MKKIFLHLVSISIVAFLLSISVFAQKEKTVLNVSQNYVISAKAGAVNYVEGDVTVLRKAGKSGFLLKNDKLEIGDKVVTGQNGKVEILLNPGSYLRLAENSEFEFLTTSLDDLRLELTRGSAMLEVFADEEFAVGIHTPNAQFFAVKSGVYRIDVQGRTSKIEVWEGKAVVADTNAEAIKEGREATVTNGEVAIAKFDRDEKDALEAWSKNRSKDLAKINAQLQRKALSNTLISAYGSNSWNIYNSFGLWIYDAAFSGYTFFPYGYGWYSPYGYRYGCHLWNVGVPRRLVIEQLPGMIRNPSNPTNDVRVAPPYEQVQNNGGIKTRVPIMGDQPSLFPSNQSNEPVRVVPVVPPSTSLPSKTRSNLPSSDN